MANHSRTMVHAEWVPRSHATTPVVFPPHPALQSGGWYHATTAEEPGPGRPPVVVRVEKSPRVAVVLSLLFGPLGLLYLSTGAGLVSTVLTAVAVGYFGLPALVLLWPLIVAAAVWGVRQRHTAAAQQPHRIRKGSGRTLMR